jgi:uracil phosphoribosyltransferase
VQPIVVPILRAGLGFVHAAQELLPDADVGFVGMSRDEETFKPKPYVNKLPETLEGRPVIVIDPMLATGGSAVAALDLLQVAGATDIRMICIVAAPEGIKLVEERHPGVHIYTPAVDQGLNEHKFIVPGLGDFGDRLYGTA